MEEEKLDVEVESSTIEQEVSSNDDQEVAQTEQTEVVETPVEKSVPEVRKPLVEEVDEMGVPLKNRLAEAQRKLQQREKELEEARQAKQQQPEEQKYTKEQLRAFAVSTEDQQSRIWALNELEKVSSEEQRRIVKEELTGLQRQQQETSIRQQTLNSVVQRNPDIAVKDSAGKFVGFNPQSPLYQRMNFYMSNPRIAQQPDALDIAEAYALRDIGYAQKPVADKTISKQANQIKSLQKKTMVEGAGSNSNVSVSSRQAAIERAKQTGSVQDASDAMGQILRDGGMMSD